jgi:hypothetical protein
MRLIDADELLRRYDEEHDGEPGRARKLIEEAPTFCGWISVKDRLPKEFGEPCIVYNGCSVQYGDYYSDGSWYTPDCYESEEIRDVTHWMPLPEKPEEA